MKPHLLHVGAMIRKLREYRKMTAADLAEKSGITAPGISDIESGKRNVTVNTLVRVADALDSTVEITMKPLNSESGKGVKEDKQ